MIFTLTENPEKFERHLTIDSSQVTSIDILAEQTGFSRQKIKQIMHKGAVWLTQGKHTRRIRRASKKLQTGQILHLYYDKKVLQADELCAQLIADEGDYSVWFKPSGMLSQGSKYADHNTIYRWAENHLQPQRNAFLVHRLDRATSGLILLAHSKKAAAMLSDLFSQRKIEKYYKALISGTLNVPCSIEEALEGKRAITRILSLDSVNQQYSLLDIQLMTGRKHQIRQHLANIKHAIIGDRLYGNASKDSIDLRLTAYKIKFTSPFDQQLKYYELPNQYYPYLNRDE